MTDLPDLPDLSAEAGNRRFREVAERDQRDEPADDSLRRWLLMERQYAAGRRHELSVYDYLGPEHVATLMRWIEPFHYPDWFVAADDPLLTASRERDVAVLERLGLPSSGIDLDHIARYNVQDYRLQRFYPVPERRAPRVVLDFGSGHGRMANLALRPEEAVTTSLISVDAIAGPYLTQRAYYAGLGLRFADYLDAERGDFDVASLMTSQQLVHLPTWRLGLVPDSSVDLVCTVQVLKELPRRLLWFVLEQFARVLKPGGSLYVRDHQQGHSPNQMPVDDLIVAHGFALEFAPHIRDRVDLHGVPRVWRRLDPDTYEETPPPAATKA